MICIAAMAKLSNCNTCSKRRCSTAMTIPAACGLIPLLLVYFGQVAASAVADPLGGQLPTISPQELEILIADAKAAGYSLAGSMFDALSSYIPSQATIMIPTDAAIYAYLLGSDVTSQLDLPCLMEYHILTKMVPLQELSRFPTGHRLPTLLPGYSVVVTDNSTHSFRIDNARVVKPDMCITTTTVTCHGIDSILNFKAYGRAAVSPAQAPLPPFTTSSPALSSSAFAPGFQPALSPFILPPILPPLLPPTPKQPIGPAMVPPPLPPPVTSPPSQLPGPEQAPGVVVSPALIINSPVVQSPEHAPSPAFSLRGEHACMQTILLVLMVGFITAPMLLL